jgi:hypothetical protein
MKISLPMLYLDVIPCFLNLIIKFLIDENISAFAIKLLRPHQVAEIIEYITIKLLIIVDCYLSWYSKPANYLLPKEPFLALLQLC